MQGRPLAWGERVPAGAQLQGIVPGHVSVVARSGTREWTLALDVHGVGVRDGKKKPVDMARQHASIERTPPARVDLDDADHEFDDPDALRVMTTSPEGAAPLGALTVDSLSADGSSLDVIRDVKLLVGGVRPQRCHRGHVLGERSAPPGRRRRRSLASARRDALGSRRGRWGARRSRR